MTGTPVVLSPREKEVTALAAEGMSNHEIATELGITVDTVKHHLTTAMRAYKVNNRVKLARAWLDTETPATRPPRAWELVAAITRIAPVAHWAGHSPVRRRLCVHTSAGTLGWDVPPSAAALMPTLPTHAADHSPGTRETYRRLSLLPLPRTAKQSRVA